MCASTASSLDPRLEEALGAKALSALHQPTRVEAHLVGEGDVIVGAYLAGPAVPVEPMLADALVRTVLDAHRYVLPPVPISKAPVHLDSTKACAFRPEVAFVVHGAKGRSELLLSLSCNDLVPVGADEVRLDVTPSRNRWLRIVEKIFPKHPGFAGLEERAALPTILGRLENAGDVEAFSVTRSASDAAAFRKWRSLPAARQAATLYEISTRPKRLDLSLRKRAVKLMADAGAYAEPPRDCDDTAKYALRFHVPKTGGIGELVDVLVTPSCGVVEVASLLTEYDDWRTSRRHIRVTFKSFDDLRRLLVDVLPHAVELEPDVLR